MAIARAAALVIPHRLPRHRLRALASRVLAEHHRSATLRAVLAVDCSPDGDAPAADLEGVVDLHEALTGTSDRAVPEQARSHDAVAAFTTSGTTGKPKLAVHSHEAVTTH